jgi:hypothetical protein
MSKRIFSFLTVVLVLSGTAVFGAGMEPEEVGGVYIIPITEEIKTFLVDAEIDAGMIEKISTSRMDAELRPLLDDLDSLVMSALVRKVNEGYGPAKMRIGIYTWTLTPED